MEGVWNLFCFFPPLRHHRILIFSLRSVWDSLTNVKVYHREWALGIWGLASCWRLLFPICVLCSKHVCVERQEARRWFMLKNKNKLHHLLYGTSADFADWQMLCHEQTQRALLIMDIDQSICESKKHWKEEINRCDLNTSIMETAAEGAERVNASFLRKAKIF